MDPSLGLSEEVSSLLRRLLQANPSERATLEEIIAHPWFENNLPTEARSMNDLYFAMSPNPENPPLSEALSRVETLILRACEPEEKVTESMLVIFPAGEKLGRN